MNTSQQITASLQAIDGIANAFPGMNADGTADTQAQSDALTGALNAAVTSGALNFSAIGISTTAAVAFAVALLPVIAAYKAATKRPTL